MNENDSTMTHLIAESELRHQVAGIFEKHRMRPKYADWLAACVVAAERDGTLSHGLLRLPGYISSLDSGWVDGQAEPQCEYLAPNMFRLNANSNFAQIASAQFRPALIDAAKEHGLVCAAIHDSHHFCALWPDVEPLANAGLLAFTCVNTYKRMVVWGGHAPVLGTNPLAYAIPRRGAPPLVVDQALSVMAQGDILLAQQAGERLPEGVGLDADGRPTCIPQDVLDGGAFLPAGGHKGASIAFLVEVLAAALTGGNFSHELRDRPKEALTFKAGQFFLVLDPEHLAGKAFFTRMETLFSAMVASGSQRFPADARYERRKLAEKRGIPVSAAHYTMLKNYLSK